MVIGDITPFHRSLSSIVRKVSFPKPRQGYINGGKAVPYMETFFLFFRIRRK